MSEHIGKIVLVNEEMNRAYILEIGPKGNIIDLPLDQVVCDDDDQYRQYPLRLENRTVQYEIRDGIVTGAYVLNLNGAFRSHLCKKCGRGAFTLAGKTCDCGNFTNSIFMRCEVCALRANRCAMCDNPV